MPNNKFDDNLKAKGYCCPFGFVRMHVRNTDTVARLCQISGCCEATIRVQRRAVREGRSKCLHRNTCLAGLWLVEAPASLLMDSETVAALAAKAEQDRAEAAAAVYFDYLRSTGVPEDQLALMPFYTKAKT